MPTTTWSALTAPASNSTSIATTVTPATLIAEDTFSNGAAGALITERTGEQASWNAHASYTTQLRLSTASRAYLAASSNTHGFAYLSESTTTADQRIRARLRWLSDPSDGEHDAGVAIRVSPTANTMYLAWWQTVSSPGLHIYSFVAGVASDLTSISLAEPTIDVDYDLDLRVQGSRVTASISGGVTATIAATDSAVTLAGRGALRAYNAGVAGSNSAGLHFDNVYVDTFASDTTSIATTVVGVPSWGTRSAQSTAWTARSGLISSWVTLA